MMDSISTISINPKDLPIIEIGESFRGFITPIDLLRAEGQIVFQMSFNQPPQGLLFKVIDSQFHFIAEIRDFDLILHRNGEAIKLDIKQVIDRSLTICFIINWSSRHLRLKCGNPGGDFLDSKEQLTQPIIPPSSLIKWAILKSLTPVTNYESEEKFRERVYSALLGLKEKIIAPGAINGFWNIHYSGGSIIAHSPKRETDIHPTIHALLHDQMLLGGIQVIPERKTGTGNLDFSFAASVQNLGVSEVFVEFKLAHSQDVIHGLESQLPNYMRNQHINYGAYCVLWFKCEWFDEPKEKELTDLEHELISKLPHINLPGIRVFTFDLGKQLSASRRVNKNFVAKEYSAEEAKEEFTNLASQWIQDVEGMSSTVEMAKHSAYQKIVSMGKVVIPFLLEDLRQNPLYWLSALRQITQKNPVQPEQRGKVKQMAEAWLNWGKQEGYIV